MRKIKLIIGLLLGLILLASGIYFLLISKKTSKPKVYRVGILATIEFMDPIIDGFKDGMRELGYIEGKNIIYDIQIAPNRRPVGNEEIIKKFVNDKIDLMLVWATEAGIEAKEVSKGSGIPIIECGGYVEMAIEGTLHRPGGYLTGVRYPGPENAIERLEMLAKIAPNIKRIWIPFLKDYPSTIPQLEILPETAEKLGVGLEFFPATSPEEIQIELERLEKTNQIPDAILMLAEPFSITPAVNDIVDTFADKHKIPVVSALVRKPNHEIGLVGDNYGPIIGWAPNPYDMGKLAAPIADKIFKGIPAGEIPVVTPENELQINLKVAQKLGLTVPEDLLERANLIVR